MSIRRLSRNAFASMALVIGTTALMIELYRFLVRELGPEQLGVWSLVVASTTAARLGEMGIGNAVMKYVSGDLGAGNPSRAAATLGMCLTMVATVMAVLCAILWPTMAAGLSLVITDPNLLLAARKLLPWSLGSLWIGAVGQIQLCALDAMQRTDLKMVVALGAGVGQLGVAYAIVPEHGLQGLGPVQLVQAVLVMAVSTTIVARSLDARLEAWLSWPRGRLAETFRYGAGIQSGAIGQLLFEPVVKALLAAFGGPSLTGYYELASRAVTQCRSVIVSGCQMLIPYLSHRAGGQSITQAQANNAYQSVHAVLFVLSIPYFAFIAAAMPLVLSLWLGRYEPLFVGMGLACALGWGVNTLAVSAYTLYMAIGRLRWTLWTQLAIGVLNVMLASFGGWLMGGAGVVGGAMLALALGSSVVTLAFHNEFGLSARDFVPEDTAAIVGVSILGASAIAAAQVSRGTPLSDAGYVVAALLIFALACSALAWRHPAIGAMVRRLRVGEGAA
jgi:O-antigen/teichoic acid export membrane protein